MQNYPACKELKAMNIFIKKKTAEVLSFLGYIDNPKYWGRLTFANSVDSDQTPQMFATVCHTYSNILNTPTGRKDYFNSYPAE